MPPSRELTVACLCGAATHTFNVPTSSLPLQSHLCSCDTSRRISGSLLTSYVNITHGDLAQKPKLSALTPYHSSNRLIRHFCSTCGTQMYLEYHSDGHFEAATGTLQLEDTEGVVEYKSCMWIEDTKDGGASDWLVSVDGNELKKWTREAGESDEVPLDHYENRTGHHAPTNKPVHAHCHCGGVEFWVQPPNAASKTARSDFSDSIVPYTQGRDASANPSNITWWLCDNDTRYLAGACACHSCRRASGFDFAFWAFVPHANIYLDSELTKRFPEYGADHRNEYWGTMRSFRSSEDTNRTFCGKCGATVFWDGGLAKGRDGLIDVAVGLLDAESGARAEELLRWWTDGRVSFEEFAVHQGLTRALGEGFRSWGRRKA